MRKILMAALALLAVACQAPPETDMTTSEADMTPERTAEQVFADFDGMRAEWQAMANADNAVGVAGLYTDDAVFTDAYGTVYDGRDAVQGYFEASFPGGTDLVIVTTDLVHHGDMVAGYGTFSQTVQGPEGEMPLAGMWQTVSMYQPDGSVKILLHQSMIPATPPMM